jgi:hypothetical protein
MSFSNKHKALIYSLFGIPKAGTSTTFLGFNLGNPLVNNVTNAHYVEGEHATIVTELNAQIAAVEALADNGTETLIKERLCRYEEIISSQLYLREKGSNSGVIADDEREIKRLRNLVGSELGWAQPLGSFVDEAKKLYDATGPGDR